MIRRSRKSRRSRRALRRRRLTRRSKRQAGGDMSDENTVVSMRDGNDPDSVETVMSKGKFDEVSTASPEASV